jgi:hypothetical protein
LERGVNGWLPEEGEQYAELDSDWDGPGGSLNDEPGSVAISQTIQTIPGRNYTISFYFSPRPSTDESNNVLEFAWDGDVKDTITGSGGSNTIWNQSSYSFTATGFTTTIKFADRGTSDSFGTFLDNVSAKCVPNP